MRDLIFIVDEEPLIDNSTEEIITTLITNGEEIEIESSEKKSKTFTTSKTKKVIEEKEDGLLNNQLASISLAVAARLFPLPIAVLTGAAPVAYSLYQLFTKKDDEDVSVDSLKQSASSFDKYLKRISMTPEMALSKKYRFQPGHPQVNIAYIKHPLSEYNSAKKNLYIPSDSLDDILLQEREAEMVRVFVTLGATKIVFHKKNKVKTSSLTKANLEAEVPFGSGQAEMKIDSEFLDIGSDKRAITLAGYEWKKDSAIDRSQFSWLPFEPSWEAIVFARETGGCLNAELELKKKTVFSSNKEGKLGVGMNMFSGVVSAGMDLNNESDEVYTVQVEFSQPV
jgi:hypothetical protein